MKPVWPVKTKLPPTFKCTMKLGADKMGNLLQNSSASLINGSINYWSILKIMRLQISTYKKKEEAVTSI